MSEGSSSQNRSQRLLVSFTVPQDKAEDICSSLSMAPSVIAPEALCPEVCVGDGAIDFPLSGNWQGFGSQQGCLQLDRSGRLQRRGSCS